MIGCEPLPRMRPGEPCPQCGKTLAAFSPGGRDGPSCDNCKQIWPLRLVDVTAFALGVELGAIAEQGVDDQGWSVERARDTLANWLVGHPQGGPDADEGRRVGHETYAATKDWKAVWAAVATATGLDVAYHRRQHRTVLAVQLAEKDRPGAAEGRAHKNWHAKCQWELARAVEAALQEGIEPAWQWEALIDSDPGIGQPSRYGWVGELGVRKIGETTRRLAVKQFQRGGDTHARFMDEERQDVLKEEPLVERVAALLKTPRDPKAEPGRPSRACGLCESCWGFRSFNPMACEVRNFAAEREGVLSFRREGREHLVFVVVEESITQVPKGLSWAPKVK